MAVSKNRVAVSKTRGRGPEVDKGWLYTRFPPILISKKVNTSQFLGCLMNVRFGLGFGSEDRVTGTSQQ